MQVKLYSQRLCHPKPKIRQSADNTVANNELPRRAHPNPKRLPQNSISNTQRWGVAKGSSISSVAKFKGGENSEWKQSNGWSRSYREIKLLLSAGKWVVAKLQGDKSAPQPSIELYDPWISGPLRVSWKDWGQKLTHFCLFLWSRPAD